MKKGFTIVELLIVIVVIAILAAIVIVSYNGITRRASESSIKSDLQNTATKLAMFKAENDSYPLTLSDSQKALSATNDLQYSSDGATYCLAVTTKTANGPAFFITEAGAIESGECPLVWTDIAAGELHTVAKASDGKLYSWGHNEYGQLGDNSASTGRINPVVISDSGILQGKTITQVVSGTYHTLVLTSEGKVYAWGYNATAQVGNGSYTNRTTPVALSESGALAGKTVTQVAAGGSFSAALASDGTVYTWGYNGQGQIGDGTTTNRIVPTAVSSFGALAGKTITQIAIGGGHSLALASDGTLITWGSNNYNQVDSSGVDRPTPVVVPNTGALAGKTITKLAAGSLTSFVLASDGTAAGWGANYYGHLGNGTTSGASSPVSLSSSGPLAGKTISQLVPGNTHALALTSDGLLYAWGWNNFGEVGDGSTSTRTTPVAITNSGALNGVTASKIYEGNYTSFVLSADGTAYSWGYNGQGQLGDGSTTNRLVPVVMSAPQ